MQFWWFVLAAFVGFGPTALLFWPLSSKEYNRSGSLVVPWVGAMAIASALVAAFWEYRGGSGTTLFPLVGVGAALAIFCRVLFDGRRNPTSHNLWPFDLVIVFVFGLVAGLVGFQVVGWVFSVIA